MQCQIDSGIYIYMYTYSRAPGGPWAGAGPGLGGTRVGTPLGGQGASASEAGREPRGEGPRRDNSLGPRRDNSQGNILAVFNTKRVYESVCSDVNYKFMNIHTI